MIELAPVDGQEDVFAPFPDWTNERGEYAFANVTPGIYVVSLNAESAPFGRVPFVGMYYPGVDDGRAADQIRVEDSHTVDLPPVRLRRVPLANVVVNVVFEDGVRPAWSNLSVHNPTYPGDGTIGGGAPEMSDGRGVFVLPAGFEYVATVSVECAKRRESPAQHVGPLFADATAEWTFVIPGSACEFWRPRSG